MTQVAPIWNAFNAGELSPFMDGRTDQDKYYSGCKTLLNMIPRVTGPASRRGGTKFIGKVKDTGGENVILLPFEFSSQQSYVLEMGSFYFRFWVNRGQLLSSGAPYEIAHPYPPGILYNSEGAPAVRHVQSGDVMWFCESSGNYAPQKLQRLGATDWTVAPSPFLNGPFDDVSPSNTITVQASATTGAGITITASSALFLDTGLIGTSFYMEDQDASDYTAWEPGKTVSAGAIRRYNGNVYSTSAGGTTGSYPPVHLRGKGNDGSVDWTYLHSGRGWAQITAVAGDGLSCTATVISRLPNKVVSASTTRWAKAAFGDHVGWPTAVSFYRQRLAWARGRKMYLSVVGDYDNHQRYDGPDVTAETAMVLELSVDTLDGVRWMANGNALLLAGSRVEAAVSEQTTQKVFAADNVKSTPQTQYGARTANPVIVGESVLYLQRGGRKLRELKYSYETERYKADDLSVLANHITERGVNQMAFQMEPDNVLWCVLNDGTLAGLTYNRERGVVAWHRHELGGRAFVRSITCIASPDATYDDVWVLAKRNATSTNENRGYYLEVIESNRLNEALSDEAVTGEATSQRDGYFVDCGLTYYDNNTPAVVITGLDHLEGDTVQVCADGGAHVDCVVAGGQITLNRECRKVHVGYGYNSVLQTMRADKGWRDGSGQSRRKSFSEVWVRLYNTVGGKVGPSLDRLDPIGYLDGSSKVGERIDMYSGDKRIMWPADFGTDGYVYVVQDQPLPLTVVAIVPRMETSD